MSQSHALPNKNWGIYSDTYTSNSSSDIASSSLIDTVQAHSATVWSIHVRPDGTGLVSGSADKDVKFWDFERKPVDSDNVSPFSSPTLEDPC